MSTAELIYQKTKDLPAATQTALLTLVDMLAHTSPKDTLTAIQPGSAQGQIKLAKDFDAPLMDFEPYTK